MHKVQATNTNLIVPDNFSYLDGITCHFHLLIISSQHNERKVASAKYEIYLHHSVCVYRRRNGHKYAVKHAISLHIATLACTATAPPLTVALAALLLWTSTPPLNARHHW